MQISKKRAARESVGGLRIVFQWADVLRALPRTETRQRVLARYRTAGFTPDHFERSTKARAAMADALTRCEDWIELDHARWQHDREAIAAVRRVLEMEIR